MLVELRPEKILLDPSFSGYKLSLDPIPVYRHNITEGVDHVCQNEDQYSFIHTKVFSLHNHLFADPWQDNTVFLVDKTWKVQKATVSDETGRVEALETVWNIPNLDQRVSGSFNTSLAFPGPDTTVVCDGGGRFHVLNTQNHRRNWQLHSSHEVEDCEGGCVLVSTHLMADSATLHCVLMSLHTTEASHASTQINKPLLPTVNTVLHWLTLTKDDKGIYSLSCKRKLEGAGSVDYVALESSCSALYIVSNTRFKFVADSSNPLPPPPPDTAETEEKPLYTWEQTEDDVTVVLEVNTNTKHDDVDVVVTERELTIRVHPHATVAGLLCQSVDKELTTWVLHPDRLEVTLVKQEIGLMWPELLPGDSKGQQRINAEVVNEVHSRLSHLCSDAEVQETGESYAPTFNLDQLEECDSAPEDNSSIARLDCNTHTVSHQISLSGHQWLMSINQGPSNSPCVCVRHDVDGCVWRLDPPKDDWACQHIGTFCALGYVAASKQQKKFTTAAPDLSYAVICEATSHVFVYRKASIIDGELRNRKTSTKVATVAKQQLINLESQSPVLGAYATNSHLFVLTSDTLHTYHIQ